MVKIIDKIIDDKIWNETTNSIFENTKGEIWVETGIIIDVVFDMAINDFLYEHTIYYRRRNKNKD